MKYIPTLHEWTMLKPAMEAYMQKHSLGATIYKAISGQVLLVCDLDRYAYLLWTKAYLECMKEQRSFCYID